MNPKGISWVLLLLGEIAVCALAYAVLPLALPLLAQPIQGAVYACLLYVLPLALGVFVPYLAARRGLAALVACALPPVAYMSFLRFAEISLWVLMACLLISVVSAAAGQELYQRQFPRGKRKKRS